MHTPKRNTNLFAFDINGTVYIGTQLQIARTLGMSRRTLGRWVAAKDPRVLEPSTDLIWHSPKVCYCDHDFYLTTY